MSLVLPTILEVVRREANQFLRNETQRGDDWVVLSSALDPDGGANPEALNKIVMTVTNINREHGNSSVPGDQLDVMVELGFIANFAAAQYKSGLEAISLLIACLHQHPLFTRQDTLDLPEEVEKVSLEMLNHNVADLNHIFGMMGLKYQPSVFYRLRLLTYRAPSLQARALVVRGGGLDPPPRIR